MTSTIDTHTAPFVHHAVSPADAAALAMLREQTAAFKGLLNGPDGRQGYDQTIAATAAAPGVTHAVATVGGQAGFWCRTPTAPSDAAILYLHGGGYVVGSAQAYQNFVGHVVARSGVNAFILDYRLAPEHPHPAALQDAMATYVGLVEQGYRKITVVGDSAGGGLSLALVAHVLKHLDQAHNQAPVCCVTLSPWTDLTCTGESLHTHIEQEFYLSPAALQAFAQHYLAGHDATDPAVSPLYGPLRHLPPMQLHVGTAELLLSDSLRYAQRAHDAGTPITAHVWDAMPHVFPSCVGLLQAADRALDSMADFVRLHTAV
jgi:monoterpene epsilon-lactone hydrolase